MTEILALQQLELDAEPEAEGAYPFPCFSVYASSFVDTDNNTY